MRRRRGIAISGAPAGSWRARALKFAEAATTPLVPSDFLDLFAPLRAGAELRGRVESVHPETADAATQRWVRETIDRHLEEHIPELAGGT